MREEKKYRTYETYRTYSSVRPIPVRIFSPTR